MTEKTPKLDMNGDDNEPKEIDKLRIGETSVPMDKNNGSDPKKSRFRHLEERFQRVRTDLSSDKNHRIIFILGSVIFLLVIVLLILIIRLSVRSEPAIAAKCVTSDCLKSAAVVVAAFNKTFDPCHDFWNFACSGWVAKNQIPDNRGSWGVADEVRDGIEHQLRHYIDLISQDVDEADPQFKVKRFYSSCLNVEDIEYNSLTTIKYEIQEIGGWSLLSSWSFQSWDRTKVIERLHTKYGVTPYFKVSVGPDDLDPNQPYIIKIEPSGLGLPSKNYYYDPKYNKQTEAYKNFMRELAKLFNAQAIQANQFAENMFAYERRIAEVSPDLEEYQRPSDYMKKRYSIRELMSIAPSIKWLSLLQNYYPNSQINEGTRVLVAFDHYLKNISQIISTTDNTAVNDYLMWRFASTYAPYLSKAFRMIANEFQQTMNGLDTNKLRLAEDRWQFCLHITSKFLGQALGSMFVKNKLISRLEQSNNARTNVINYIRSSIKANKNWFVWAGTEEAQQLINRKVGQMELMMSQPNFVLKNEIEKYYSEFIVQNNFYQNILNGIHFLNRKNDILLKSRNSVSDYSWKLLPQDVDIVYEYAANRLTIPAGFLHFPLYDSNLPTPMQFGSLGFHVSAQLLRAFDLTGLQYGLPDFRLSPDQTWIGPESKQDFDSRLQCLSSELQELAEQSQSIYPNLTLSQTYADIGALKFAFDAYNNFISERGQEGHLPGVALNNEQLFFLSFAQSMCESVRPQKSMVLSEYITSLPGQLRVWTVLRQSDRFSRAFGCDKRSPMKSEQMCHLWH